MHFHPKALQVHFNLILFLQKHWLDGLTEIYYVNRPRAQPRVVVLGDTCHPGVPGTSVRAYQIAGELHHLIG